MNIKEYLLPITLMALTALSGLALTALSASADTSGTVTLTVDVPASCSLTVNPSSHTVTINPGNTGLIGTSTIKSICNDPAGLAVYAVGYTNDTYGNNNLSSTVGANTINIATAVTPSGTPSTSEWNMTLAAISGDYAPTITTGYDSAHIIPDVYTKVAYRNTMTDIGTNATGAQFTASFNAYIAPTQAAGTYTGKVKFLLVHPNVLTWQEDWENPGNFIPDEEQPDVLACEPAEYDTFDPSVTHYLQDVAQWENQVALEQEVTAYDRRDNQAYKVKRLKMSADGCQTALWMSNLNLGAEPFASGVTELNSTNTNLATGVSAIPVSTFMGWIKTSGTGSYTNPELIPLKSSTTCEFFYDDNSYELASCLDEDSYGNKFGTLYNYAAASAGTYTYASSSGTGDATSDLCPSGWRMPTSNEELDENYNPIGEFDALVTAYNLIWTWDTTGRILTQQDLGFSFAGEFEDGVPKQHLNQFEGGGYWSSSFIDEHGMYEFNIYREFGLNPHYYSTRDYGLSVRCIVK